MARVPAYVKSTSGQYTEAGSLIWGDTVLQALEFADAFRPHRNPLSGDPAWNSLRSDYVSLTDALLQTVVPPRTANPGFVFSSAFMTATNPVMPRFTDGSTPAPGRGIDFIPTGPSIVEYAESTGLSFTTILLSFFEPDLNKMWDLVTFDPANTMGFGVNAIAIGDDGISTFPLQGVEQTSGNLKFLSAAGANADMTTFDYVKHKAVRVNVITVTANYTMLASDYAVLVDATGAARTVTLPLATNAGQKVVIAKKDSSVNAVTVSRAGTDTIEGAVSLSLATQFKKANLISDGVGVWYDLGAGLV